MKKTKNTLTVLQMFHISSNRIQMLTFLLGQFMD